MNKFYCKDFLTNINGKGVTPCNYCMYNASKGVIKQESFYGMYHDGATRSYLTAEFGDNVLNNFTIVSTGIKYMRLTYDNNTDAILTKNEPIVYTSSGGSADVYEWVKKYAYMESESPIDTLTRRIDALESAISAMSNGIFVGGDKTIWLADALADGATLAYSDGGDAITGFSEI